MAILDPVLGAIATAILRVTYGGTEKAMRRAFPFAVRKAIVTAIEKANCEGTREGTSTATWTVSRAVRM